MENDRFSCVRARAADYMKTYDADFVTEYMYACCGHEMEDVMACADQLMKQTFVFEDRWDMEPCGVPYTLEDMVWNCSPNRDPEWVYMLNRHEYLYKLLLAFRFTKHTKYTDKLKWYLNHWIANNPITPGETMRTIDTGIRCMSWQYLLLPMIGEGLMSQDETEPVLASLCSQFVYMRRHYIGKYTLSNWGVLQTAAICQGYLWFSEYLPEDGLENWAWSELHSQLSLQVMEDGSHWEQSMMYHVEVLLACMKLLSSWEMRHGTEELPEDKMWLKETIWKMSLYVLYAAGPDHNQIAQCDSDVTDVRDILVKAAVLTGDERLRFGGYDTMDLASAWLLGREGIGIYGRLKALRPQERSMSAVDTGGIFIRSSWKADSHFTYLTCGPLGSGHGHADLTHISLYYKGVPFLVDSGRYSYMEEEPLRPALKMAQAHNVCVLDNESHGIPDGSWGYETYGECLKNYVREEGPVHYCEMAYHGRNKDGANYLCMRRVMTADSGIWLIVNDIRCDGEHQLSEYYHLDSRVSAKEGDTWLLSSGNRRLRLGGSGKFRKEPCLISEHYNQLLESACLVKVTSFEGRHTDWTFLAGDGIEVKSVPVYQYGAAEPAGERQVTAVEFTYSARESWIFLIWNRETCRGAKLYECGGVPVYGKAAAIHCADGKRTLYRLRN